MSEKPTTLEVNALTGEEIIRELTVEEISEIEKMKKSIQSDAKSKAKDRISALEKLAALGLTEAEIDAL